MSIAPRECPGKMPIAPGRWCRRFRYGRRRRRERNGVAEQDRHQPPPGRNPAASRRAPMYQSLPVDILAQLTAPGPALIDPARRRHGGALADPEAGVRRTVQPLALDPDAGLCYDAVSLSVWRSTVSGSRGDPCQGWRSAACRARWWGWPPPTSSRGFARSSAAARAVTAYTKAKVGSTWATRITSAVFGLALVSWGGATVSARNRPYRLRRAPRPSPLGARRRLPAGGCASRWRAAGVTARRAAQPRPGGVAGAA